MDVAKHFRLTHDPFKAGAERGFAASDNAVLSHEEARCFIMTRIGVAGRSDLFSPAALDLIATASRGRPAALRLLAGNAMFHAAFDGARRVEEVHARQAAATQDIWRDVPAPAEAAVSAPPTPVAATPVAASAATAAPMIIAPAEFATQRAVETVDDEPPPQRGWWRNVPPLARLAMVVGLLILSLPVIGYIVGEVKDERPAPESSYLPEDGELAAADAEAPIDAEPELAAAPPEPAPVAAAEAGPPVDLTAQTTAPAPTGDTPPEPPVAVGAGQAEPAPTETTEPEVQVDTGPTAAPEPAPAAPEPAPAAPAGLGAAPRVFVHYSAAQAGGAEAAAVVARRLREQGFTVVDLRAVPVSIEAASVRYFYVADRAQAEALHDALGAALRPRGFSAGDLKSMTDYADLPRRGTLEVWVPAS